MSEPADETSRLRASLIEALYDTRSVEREVFAALGAADRDARGADGGWSSKDVLAHLSAWRQRQADKLGARREGREDAPDSGSEIDEINAGIHAERTGWAWDRVVADAESTADALMAEVSKAAIETLTDPKIVAAIMGDGPEHDLAHLSPIAAGVGLGSRVLGLADSTLAILDRGGWPPRPAAFARYNLACFYALGGHLDAARSLLRQVLPEQEELRTLAPGDDDLLALREEIPSLVDG